jgi:hypothetical protein
MRPLFFSILITGLLLVTGFSLPVHAVTSCNDIELTPLHVSIQEEKEGKSISFTLENEAEDPFEIDDVKVDESSPFFDLSVIDFPSEVDGESTGKIKLEYDSIDVNSDQDDSFQIRIKGKFDDDDSECSFSDLSFTIDVTVEDGEDACSLIEVEADNVSVSEGETITHTITLKNSSNEDFEIQGFNLFDDSSHFSANLEPKFTDSEFDKNLSGNANQSYSVEIDAQTVSNDETDSVFIEVRGEFEDGVDCSFSEIEGDFDVTIEDEGVDSGVCSDVTLDAPTITLHANKTTADSVTLTNKSAQNFFVDEFEIADKNYQIAFSALDVPDVVAFGEADGVSFEATGYSFSQSFDGNAFISMKGHFTSGSTCFVSAKKLPFHAIGSDSITCSEFYTNLPYVTVLKGSTSQDVYVHNPLAQPAIVAFTLSNGTVSPSILHVPADTAKTQTLYFTGVSESQTLTLAASISGCDSIVKQSTLLFSGLDDAPVQFVNPPTVLTIGSAKEFVLQLKNKSAFTQEAEIKIITKPGNQTYIQTIFIPGLDEPLIYLPTSVLMGKNTALIQVKSAGYIVTHTLQLANAQAIVVTPKVSDSPTIQNEYTVDVTIQNPTPQPVEGEVVVDVPDSWSVSGNTHINLAPYESITIPLKVKPDTVLSVPFTGGVYFSGSPHSSIGKTLSFKPAMGLAAGVTTAFVTGSSGLWLGLIVLLALIGIWYVAKPKTIVDTLTNPFKPPISDQEGEDEDEERGKKSDNEQEPWMNPPTSE